MLSTVRRRFHLLIGTIIVIMTGVWLFVQFAGSEERHLYALDAATGKVAWSEPLDWNWSSYQGPIVDGGRVFIATNDIFTEPRTQHWQLTAYDATSGRTLWNYAPFGQAGVGRLCASMIAAAPVVANGQIYTYVCAATDPNNATTFDKTSVVALDEATGAVLWEYAAPSLENILIDGAALTLRVLDGSVYLLSMDSTRRWRVDVLDEKHGTTSRYIELPDLINAEAPALPVDGLQTDGQSLFFHVKGLTSLDPISGKANYILQSSAVPWTAENGLYASAFDKGAESIIAYDAKSGTVRWQRTLDQTLIPDSPDNKLRLSFHVQADAKSLYLFASNALKQMVWLLALNPADGSTRWVKRVAIDPMVGNVLAKVATTTNLVVYDEAGDTNGTRVLSAADGLDRWFFPGYTKDAAPAIDGQHVYLVDESERYRNWLALLNPAWHG